MSKLKDLKRKKSELTKKLLQETPFLKSTLENLEEKAPGDLYLFLDSQDGAAKLAKQLPRRFKPEEVIGLYDGPQVVWENFGVYFYCTSRFYEAINIFSRLYEHLFAYQKASGNRVHKGVPLFRLAMCHTTLRNMVTAKRYFMLTLCEDAIKDRGKLNFQDTGSYFQLVWHFGLSDSLVKEYVGKVWALHRKHPAESQFPEWSLQQLDQDWIVESPSPAEMGQFHVSAPYAKWLLDRTEDTEGKSLELLAQYLISTMPGCRARRRVQSEESDYDVVGILEGSFLDFRSELGRYFLVECKDWSTPADFTTVAKFCRVLDAAKCRFGILFSRKGVSGTKETRFGHRGIVKVFQDRGIVIVVVTKDDLVHVVKGANFLAILRSKYEDVRLDLRRTTKSKK